MCVVNIPINDGLMQQMRPLFASEEGITQWMQEKMTSLIKKHIAAEEKRKAQNLSRQNRQWLADRLIEPTDAAQTEPLTYRVARTICTEEEYQELLNEGFLDNPQPQFGPFTDEEIIQRIIEGEKEGYVGAERSKLFMDSLLTI